MNVQDSMKFISLRYDREQGGLLPDEYEDFCLTLREALYPIRKKLAKVCKVSPVLRAGESLVLIITPSEGWPPAVFSVYLETRDVSPSRESYAHFALDGEDGVGGGHVDIPIVERLLPIAKEDIQKILTELYDHLKMVAEIPDMNWSFLHT